MRVLRRAWRASPPDIRVPRPAIGRPSETYASLRSTFSARPYGRAGVRHKRGNQAGAAFSSTRAQECSPRRKPCGFRHLLGTPRNGANAACLHAGCPELAPWLLPAVLTDSGGAGRANSSRIQVDSLQIRKMPTFTSRRYGQVAMSIGGKRHSTIDHVKNAGATTLHSADFSYTQLISYLTAKEKASS